jgi:hypothetical protein
MQINSKDSFYGLTDPFSSEPGVLIRKGDGECNRRDASNVALGILSATSAAAAYVSAQEAVQQTVINPLAKTFSRPFAFLPEAQGDPIRDQIESWAREVESLTRKAHIIYQNRAAGFYWIPEYRISINRGAVIKTISDDFEKKRLRPIDLSLKIDALLNTMLKEPSIVKIALQQTITDKVAEEFRNKLNRSSRPASTAMAMPKIIKRYATSCSHNERVHIAKTVFAAVGSKINPIVVARAVAKI